MPSDARAVREAWCARVTGRRVVPRGHLAQIGGASGIAGVAVLLAIMILLTIVEWDYLADVGWSPIRRTPTEWPSLLALGPNGWLMGSAFVIGGMGSVALAIAIFVTASRPLEWLLAAATAVGGVGLFGVAFPADHPEAVEPSWHGQLHNGLYWLIPISILTTQALGCLLDPRPSRWRRSRASARALLPITVIALGLTNLNAIAQGARYFVFGSAMVMTVTLSLAVRDAARAQTP